MRKKISAGIFAAAAFFIFLSCNTYHIGGAYEMQNRTNKTGVLLGGSNEYIENAFFYFPKSENEFAHTIGYDINIKYPLRFFNDSMGIYPMVGFESRYSFFDSSFLSYEENQLGLGIKFGGGLEISFIPAMFFRFDAFYQPEFSTFMDSFPGTRFSASLGFRTNNDPVRRRIKEKRASAAAERERAQRPLNLERTAARNPNDARAQYEWGYYLYITQKDYVKAARVFERIINIDPNFRVTGSFFITAREASNMGFTVTQNLEYSNFSIYCFLGAAYRDSAQAGGANPSYRVAAADRQSTLDKALAAFVQGYEIDIVNGRNTGANLKTAYTAFLIRGLKEVNRLNEANAMYAELAKTAVLTDAAAAALFGDWALTYEMSGRRRGNYTRQRNGSWLFNGAAVREAAVTIKTVSNAWIVSIDGKSPSQFYARNRTSRTRENLRAIYDLVNFPAEVTEFFRGEFILPEMYDIKVISFQTRGNRIYFSEDVWNSSEDRIYSLYKITTNMIIKAITANPNITDDNRPALVSYEIYTEDLPEGKVSFGINYISTQNR